MQLHKVLCRGAISARGQHGRVLVKRVDDYTLEMDVAFVVGGRAKRNEEEEGEHGPHDAPESESRVPLTSPVGG